MIVVGSTMPAWKADDNEELDWLNEAEDMAKLTYDEVGAEVRFVATAELDSRGIIPFGMLRTRLNEIKKRGYETDFWTFNLGTGDTVIDSGNRLIRITTGRNLIEEYATRQPECTHILFLDSDLKVPADSIVKLLELNLPIVGGDVPSYCLNGPIDENFGHHVQIHWNTAGYLLVNRDVFRRVKWRTDHRDIGATDDPCFAADCNELGFGETRVRKDLIGIHRPLIPLEDRGHNLELQ